MRWVATRRPVPVNRFLWGAKTPPVDKFSPALAKLAFRQTVAQVKCLACQRFHSGAAYAVWQPTCPNHTNCPFGQSTNCFQEEIDMAAKKTKKRKALKTGKKLSGAKTLGGVKEMRAGGPGLDKA